MSNDSRRDDPEDVAVVPQDRESELLDEARRSGRYRSLPPRGRAR